ncbi:MAG: efflux RND transporter permease subunit [Planctomycetes bacterium]|nr:efflux RND transporter permease subunit [Planctomycetota bacterium]
MRLAIPVVLILAGAFPASAADPTTGIIRVTTTYPGVDARTVDETVLTPLFRQINGVEGATRIESEARNDGTGTLTVYFEPKTDLNLARAMVQNRVSLALPVIPEPCRQLGISVRKLPAGPPTFWLALTSADDKYDSALLGTYATVRLKNELARIPGVVDVRIVGVGEFGVRVWLNPDRLTAYKLTAGDVIDTLRRQNARVAAGGVVGGQGLRSTVAASARLTGIEQFAAVILKANREGELLRLRDVARVELESAAGGFARVDGKPAALIAVTAWPGRVTAEQLCKIEAADDLPPGMRFDLVADRATNRLLEVEVRLPNSAALERTEKVVERAAELIRGRPGKPGIVAFSEQREPNAATMFIKVPAKGGPTAAEVEKALAVIPDAAIRVGSVPPGGEAFSVRLALMDPDERSEDRFSEVTARAVEQLTKDAGAMGVVAFPGPAGPHFAVNVDREKCATLGVELDDIFTTLQTTLSGVYATEFNKYGRTWRVTVQTEPRLARQIEDLNRLRVRSAAGEMVPLENVITVRKALAPPAVVRVNGYRAVVITAAPAAGRTPAEVAAQCVKLVQEVLPKGYRLKDLTEPLR